MADGGQRAGKQVSHYARAYAPPLIDPADKPTGVFISKLVVHKGERCEKLSEKNAGRKEMAHVCPRE